MLAAPAVAPTAPTFEPPSNTFRFPPQQQPRIQQQQRHNQQQQQNPYQASSESASMSYSHGRGGMSFSSTSSRGTGVNGLPYQQQTNYSNTIPASNTVMSNGMTEASSSSTITAQAVANNARRNRRPDTEELKRVGRVHYQELFHFLRTHLAKGECQWRCNCGYELEKA